MDYILDQAITGVFRFCPNYSLMDANYYRSIRCYYEDFQQRKEETLSGRIRFFKITKKKHSMVTLIDRSGTIDVYHSREKTEIAFRILPPEPSPPRATFTFYIPFLIRTRHPFSAFIPFFKYHEASCPETPVARFTPFHLSLPYFSILFPHCLCIRCFQRRVLMFQASCCISVTDNNFHITLHSQKNSRTFSA